MYKLACVRSYGWSIVTEDGYEVATILGPMGLMVAQAALSSLCDPNFKYSLTETKDLLKEGKITPANIAWPKVYEQT